MRGKTKVKLAVAAAVFAIGVGGAGAAHAETMNQAAYRDCMAMNPQGPRYCCDRSGGQEAEIYDNDGNVVDRWCVIDGKDMFAQAQPQSSSTPAPSRNGNTRGGTYQQPASSPSPAQTRSR